MAAFIIGTGRHLPQQVMTNGDLEALLETSAEWIFKNTGIRTRRWAEATTATSDLAVGAVQEAIQKSGLRLEDVDYLIAGTMTPDHQVPGIGPIIQAKLGLRHIPCLDVRTACCNPLYGFEIASALVESHRANHVLIVGAEIQSIGLKLTPDARDVSSVFGDGAGACLVARSQRPGAIHLIDIQLFTDGKFVRDLAVLAPGTGNGTRWYEEDPRYHELYYPVMNGRTVILHAARKISDAGQSLLQRNNLSAQDIDLVIPHQANANLLLAIGRQLDIPEKKIVSVLEWCGNTSSASILIALDWAYEQQLISSGNRILFLAFGAGFAWGAALGKVQ